MTTKTGHLPKYRQFKPRNLAVVRIRGKDHYLGAYGSPASYEKYHLLLAQFHQSQAKGDSTPTAAPSPTSTATFLGINNLVEQYLNFANIYYGNNGNPSREYVQLVYALEPLCQLFGLSIAHEFGPKSLKLIQEHMIVKDWSRNLINHRINRIRRMFKWAVGEEFISPTILHGLQAVPGLRYGRSAARETEPVKPVDDAHVDAILPYVTPHVAAMIRVQRLTGMRPCEVVLMRIADLDRSGEIWFYEPPRHKNLWRGHKRQIPLGPKVQELLRPFLDRSEDAYIFSPIESERQRNVVRRELRHSPMTPSQALRRPKPKPKRAKRGRYGVDSYRRAISYGIKKANRKRNEEEPKIPAWAPNQLRHTRATEVRRLYGLDGAQSALGHKNADVTQVYAEKSLELATKIAKETG